MARPGCFMSRARNWAVGKSMRARTLFYDETGIALMANATSKRHRHQRHGGKCHRALHPLHYALEAFTANAGQYRAAVKDFVDNFGDSDLKALAENLKTLKPYYPAATWREGFDATILAIKANEAAVEQQKIKIEKELFDL